jgi:putative membrane protein
MRSEAPARVLPWQGVIAGAVGGLAASWAMEQFQARFSQATRDGVDEAQRRSGYDARWSARSQDQLSGQPEPATAAAGNAAAITAIGRPLTLREEDAVGPFMHYAFGAVVGALYGAIAESRPGVTRLAGIPFGMGVWTTADEVGAPAAGLSYPAWERPLRAHTYSVLSHAVYGLTTEAVRRLVRSALP